MDVHPLAPMVLALLSALALTWVLRADAASHSLVLQLWKTVEIAVGLVLMLGLFYVGTLQILVRYAPAGTLYASWTEELARLLMVWMTFWGAAFVQRTDGHMAVSVVYDLLPSGLRKLVRLAGDGVVLLLLAVLLKEGWRVAYLQHGQTTITLDITIAAFAYALPVGGTLMLVFLILDIVGRWRGNLTATDPAAERAV